MAMVGSGNVEKIHSLLHGDCYMKIHGGEGGSDPQVFLDYSR